MKISIIIPCFNAEKFIANALNSAFNSFSGEKTTCEIICVDDCSLDKTAEIIAQYEKNTNGRVRLCRHRTNLGANESRRTGALAACGDYLLYMDPDDELTAGSVDALSEFVVKTPVDVVFFNFQFLETPSPAQLAQDKALKAKVDWYARVVDGAKFASSKEKIMDAIFGKNKQSAPWVWSRMWKRSLVVEAFSLIPQGYCVVQEDDCEVLTFLALSISCAYCDIIGYKYRLDSGYTSKTMTSKDAIRQLRNCLFVAKFMIAFRRRFSSNKTYIRYLNEFRARHILKPLIKVLLHIIGFLAKCPFSSSKRRRLISSIKELKMLSSQ